MKFCKHDNSKITGPGTYSRTRVHREDPRLLTGTVGKAKKVALSDYHMLILVGETHTPSNGTAEARHALHVNGAPAHFTAQMVESTLSTSTVPKVCYIPPPTPKKHKDSKRYQTGRSKRAPVFLGFRFPPPPCLPLPRRCCHFRRPEVLSPA